MRFSAAEFARRVRSLFQGEKQDKEMDAELQAHLEFAVEENMQRGMTEEQPRREARLRFGGVQQARELQREARSFGWLDVLRQDIRFALRTLRRDGGFTIVAVLILGLGIGVNVAVFSVVNAVLLRPLSFREPQQLLRILTKDPKGGESSSTYTADSMREMAERSHTLQSVTGYFAFSANDNVKLMGQGQPQPITGMSVAGNFFDTLGVEPLYGRFFRPEEAVHGARPVVVLSYAFWKQQYNADMNLVGQPVNLDGSPVTVVGVLSPSFDFGAVFSPGRKVDVYTPAVMEDIRHWGNTMALVGRMRPGITAAQAQAEADLVFPTLDHDTSRPANGKGYPGRLLTLKDFVSGKLRRSLLVLWAAVGLILLIVCVNLSNLLLARAATRNKEFALRTALGAGRARLIRQLVTESIVLSLAGAGLGLVLAAVTTAYLTHQTSIILPLLSSVTIDGQALAWTVALALLCGCLFGMGAAFKASGANMQEALKEGGRGATSDKGHERLRSLLVISEVALACVLLVGAGLMLRSFLRVLDVDLGFQPSQTAAISIDSNDRDSTKRAVLWHNLLDHVGAVGGVESAGISDGLPLSGNRSWDISAKGKEYRDGELQDTFVYIVSPEYLHTMGIRLLEGRDLTWDDGAKSRRVVIINQTVAHRLWPGQDPVGQTALIGGTEATVIGVAADVRETSAELPAGWQMYLSGGQFGADSPYLVVRTKLDPSALAPSVMQALRQLNPRQPATEFQLVQSLVDHAVSPRRFFAMLVAIFAALGLILAALGIYGVISYSVAQRTQEIGIRMALGSSAGKIRLDVLTRTMRMALIGLAAGALISFAASRTISSLLYGTTPNDPVTFLGMVALICVVAALAGYLPAYRASRIDPMEALRNN
ncbi:MAG TPA: ABC transporter permease [Acidobacteriaceae bacterium]|jgi:predicted permease